MRSQVSSQIHALNRVRYLLDEGSFKQLEKDSPVFTDIVENLHVQIEQHMSELSNPKMRIH